MNHFFAIILNSLFTDSLHFPSVFTHGFIQLFVNVMNRMKINNLANTEEIGPAYGSKYSTKCKNHVILLMIADGEK